MLVMLFIAHGMVIFTGGSRKEVTGEFSKYGTSASPEAASESAGRLDGIEVYSLVPHVCGMDLYRNPTAIGILMKHHQVGALYL